MKLNQTFFFLMMTILSLNVFAVQVRTSTKITEYFIKNKNSNEYLFKNSLIQIGNRIDSGTADPETVQTAEIKLKSQASDIVIENEVKSLAELVGHFKITNVDEKRKSEKICINRKDEKVCHSSIDFEFSAESKKNLSRERSASRRENLF